MKHVFPFTDIHRVRVAAEYQKKKEPRVNSEGGMCAFNLRATFVSVCTRPPAEEAYLCSPVIYRSFLSVCSWPLSDMQPYKC